MSKKRKWLFDLAGAVSDRDMGVALAFSKEPAVWWLNALIVIVRELPVGWEGLAEQFQPIVLAKLGRGPHVPQVWGALVIALLKMEWFEHTGQHVPCHKRSSHACDGKILRKLA